MLASPPPPPFNLHQFPLIDTLRLIRTPHVGCITFFKLLQRYGSPAKALEALPELSQRGGSRRPLTAFPASAAESEIEKTQIYGARMLVFGEADYPAWLTTINDPPPLITILGNPAHWRDKNGIAMVGARNASANGCALAGKLAKEIGDRGWTIVSGLARGIDTFAHKGALSTGTVGVVASGIDIIYPPENKYLFAALAEQGAIISEQPLGQAPFNTSFPSRNRIIAGMTLGTIVIEAALKSGSLITARNAMEYNREVFAVPGSPLDPRAQGCNRLIKDGAMLAECADDILPSLMHHLIESGPALREQPGPSFQAQPSACEALTDESTELETARPLITEKLGYAPISMDELSAQCPYPTSVLLTILLELELAGRLTRHPGGQVCLSPQEAMESLI